MDTISLYSSSKIQLSMSEFEEAFYNSMRKYSLRHLVFSGKVTQENILEALQKSMQICNLAGINSRHHFKKIYVYDEALNTICIDWRMSKKGFNLMVMQLPSLNEKLPAGYGNWPIYEQKLIVLDLDGTFAEILSVSIKPTIENPDGTKLVIQPIITCLD